MRHIEDFLSAASSLRMRTSSRLFFLVAILACALFVGCKKPIIKKTPLAARPVIVADDARAQENFDRALDLLEGQKWSESREAFRLVQAEYPDDPIALMAELYGTRALLEQVDFAPTGKMQSSASAAAVEQALQGFDALVRSRRLDDRVRFAASLYTSMAYAILGKSARAMKQLEKYPGPSLGHAILARDRIAGWLLLSGAFDSANRHEDALEAMASLHEEVLEHIDRVGEDATDAEREASDLLTLYARGRGFAIAAEEIEEKELQMRFLVSDSAFLQAASGWALLQRRADDRLDAKTRATLEEIYTRSSSAMVTIGALEAAAEMSTLMATLGEERRLVIGALVPMSGSARAVGQRIMRGMLLAQQGFDFPDDARHTLVFRDSTQDARANMKAFKEMGALAVVGPIQKGLTPAYSEAATAEEIPILMLTTELLRPKTGEDLLTMEQSWVFRNFLHAEAEAAAVARLSFDTYGDRRVVVLRPDIGYGEQMERAFTRALEARGGSVVKSITYDREATDYGKVARAVARAKPDAIFIPDAGGKVAEVASFLARENIWGVGGEVSPSGVKTSRRLVHYLGTSLWQEALLVEQAGEQLQGATIPAWYSPAATDALSQAFTARYRVIYGSEPSIYEAFAYDSVVWLGHTILKMGMRRPKSVRDALASPTAREGVTGSARFVAWGEADRELRFISVAGKKFIPLSSSVKVHAREFLEGTRDDGDSSQPTP